MCFSSAPTPQPVEPAPPPASPQQTQTISDIAQKNRLRLMAAQGQQSTILTGPLGTGPAGKANTGVAGSPTRTLLGGS